MTRRWAGEKRSQFGVARGPEKEQKFWRLSPKVYSRYAFARFVFMSARIPPTHARLCCSGQETHVLLAKRGRLASDADAASAADDAGAAASRKRPKLPTPRPLRRVRHCRG